MSLHKEIEKLKWDKRLTEWYVSRGKLKKEDLEAYLKSLPDSATNVEQFSLGNDEAGDADLDLTGRLQS